MKGFAERSNEKMTTLKETVTTTTEVISGFFSVVGEKAAAAGNWLWEHFGAVWLLLKEVVLYNLGYFQVFNVRRHLQRWSYRRIHSIR